jgi:signal peptide peptidase SppA
VDRYSHVIRYASQTPWAIRLETLAMIREILYLRAHGHRFTAEEIDERIDAGPPRPRSVEPSAGVAIIPVHGIIGPRQSMFNNVSSGPGTGLDALTETVRLAAADPNISAMVLDVDSPGGTVDMLPETAQEIRKARQRKPVVAVANTMAASAAYWIASQGSELVVSPSGSIGSVGVYSIHDDISSRLEMEGVRTTVVSAGKYKVENSPFQPLSDDARSAIQQTVDDHYAMFVRDVARGRRTEVDSVRSGFGEGRMVTAQRAVRAGMADRVATLDDVVRGLVAPQRQSEPNAANVADSNVWVFEAGTLTTSELRAAEGFPLLEDELEIDEPARKPDAREIAAILIPDRKRPDDR